MSTEEKTSYTCVDFNDEIDLLLLWEIFVDGFKSSWKLIVSIIIIIQVITALIYLNVKPVYTVQTVIIKPYPSQFSELNLVPALIDTVPKDKHKSDHSKKSEDRQEILRDKIYKEFLNQLSGYNVLKVLHEKFKDTPLIEEFSKDNFKISFPSEEDEFGETTVTLNISDPVFGVNTLRFLVSRANELAEKILIEQWKTSLSKQILLKKEEFKLENVKVSRELDSKIANIEYNNGLKIKELRVKINSLLKAAQKEKENRLKRLIEDYELAKKLNIENPAVDITDQTSLYGYWLGTNVLLSEIKRLKKRKYLKPFIPEVVQLEKKIFELEHDPAPKVLRKRKSNIPFSEELRKILNEQVSLENQLKILDCIDFNTFSYKRPPIKPVTPIKPKKIIFLIIPIFLSLVATVGVGLLVGLINRRKQQSLRDRQSPEEIEFLKRAAAYFAAQSMSQHQNKF